MGVDVLKWTMFNTAAAIKDQLMDWARNTIHASLKEAAMGALLKLGHVGALPKPSFFFLKQDGFELKEQYGAVIAPKEVSAIVRSHVEESRRELMRAGVELQAGLEREGGGVNLRDLEDVFLPASYALWDDVVGKCNVLGAGYTMWSCGLGEEQEREIDSAMEIELEAQRAPEREPQPIDVEELRRALSRWGWGDWKGTTPFGDGLKDTRLAGLHADIVMGGGHPRLVASAEFGKTVVGVQDEPFLRAPQFLGVFWRGGGGLAKAVLLADWEAEELMAQLRREGGRLEASLHFASKARRNGQRELLVSGLTVSPPPSLFEAASVGRGDVLEIGGVVSVFAGAHFFSGEDGRGRVCRVLGAVPPLLCGGDEEMGGGWELLRAKGVLRGDGFVIGGEGLEAGAGVPSGLVALVEGARRVGCFGGGGIGFARDMVKVREGGESLAMSPIIELLGPSTNF